MTWRTHLLCGISALWIVVAIPPDLLTLDYGALAMGAVLGSLLPDLDASESKIKHLRLGTFKPFSLPAHIAHHTAGHRGVLHSLLGLVLATLLCVPLSTWLGASFVVALTLGYGSHLLADACTPRGIPILYPNSQRYRCLPRPLRIVTGSLAEDILLPVLAASAIILLLTQFPLNQL